MSDRQTVLDAFHFRYACKAFHAGRKIPDADFETVLEAGRLSPSSFGYEPWKFVVIQTPSLREKLLPVVWGAAQQLPTSSHFLALLAHKDGMRHDGAHARHMVQDIHRFPPDKVAMRDKVFRKFQESDFRLLESGRALFDWNCKQVYIALGNMMTAAALLGIDSCPIEGYDQDAAEALLAQAGLLDRERMGLAVMVAFGYRVQPAPPKSRQPLGDIVTWA